MFAVFVLFAVAIAVSEAQHGTTLHSICHSNHLQQTEDQVIEQVVNEMDKDGNGNVVESEILFFFAGLMGSVPDVDPTLLASLDKTLLLQLAAGLEVPRHEFVQAWHTKYHDSVEFVQATFDALDNFDGTMEGVLDAADIEAILNHAMTFDANHDGTLQRSELVAYLEHIYKSCP